MVKPFTFLAATTATTQLIEQAFRILGRLRMAYQCQKSIVEVLACHESEIKSIKIVVGIIEDVEVLQTPAVAPELIRLQKVQYKLAEFLVDLDPELNPKLKSKANQIARRLTPGSTDERTLSGIMDELVHIKATLLLRIQVARVGVIRTVERQLVANMEFIQSIDQYLKDQVENCQGLLLAELLKGRLPSSDGTIPLTEADLRSLGNADNDVGDNSEYEPLVDGSESTEWDISVKTERIILRNNARNQAIQINAALGEDIWKKLNRLEIKNNIAEDQAVQLNYGTTMEAAMLLLKIQGKNIAARSP